MTTLVKFLKSLIESQQSIDERYLAAAVDICDLERRMQALDRFQRGQTRALAF